MDTAPSSSKQTHIAYSTTSPTPLQGRSYRSDCMISISNVAQLPAQHMKRKKTSVYRRRLFPHKKPSKLPQYATKPTLSISLSLFQSNKQSPHSITMPLIAFFGATGGSTISCLAPALEAGYHCTACKFFD